MRRWRGIRERDRALTGAESGRPTRELPRREAHTPPLHGPRPLPEVVLPHPDRRAHPREAVHHHAQQRPVPQPDHRPRVDPVEERPSSRRARPPHGSGPRGSRSWWCSSVRSVWAATRRPGRGSRSRPSRWSRRGSRSSSRTWSKRRRRDAPRLHHESGWPLMLDRARPLSLDSARNRTA